MKVGREGGVFRRSIYLRLVEAVLYRSGYLEVGEGVAINIVRSPWEDV